MNLYNQLGQMRPMVMQPGSYPNVSVSKGKNPSVAKNRYASLYQKALNDKIQQQLIRTQMDQLTPKSVNKSGINRHTPSSASIQVSILELIEFVLNEYEQNYPVTQKPINTKDPYTIYEDLKIIFCLGSTEDQITKAQYQKLADEKYISRSCESIKSRYQDYLKYLTRDDYQNILSYIDTNGLKGYLIFEKDDKGSRFLQRIQKQDPKSSHSDTLHPNSNRQSSNFANLYPGQNNNLSASHTPLRSPRGMNEERPISPSMFSISPSKRVFNNPQFQNANNYMPYYMPQFSYPMYHPQQQQQLQQQQLQQQAYMGGDTRMSPFKPPMFFDPQTQQPMMYPPPPYFMNPYMYNQVPFAPYINQSGYMNAEYNENDDNESVQFEVRPSLKKSSAKQQVNDMEDECSESINKKKKGNNQQVERKVSQTIAISEPKQSSKQQKPQQSNQMIIEKPLQIQAQKKLPPKVQTTLVLPQFSGIQIQKPHYLVQQGMQVESQLKQQTQVSKALTKEVYDLISDDDRIPEDQFESMMQYVAEKIKLPKESVIDLLDSLSGSFKDLSIYLETKQENALWNPEEDKILSSIKSQDSSEFKLLVKLKGLASIKKRIIYNNVELPFRIV